MKKTFANIRVYGDGDDIKIQVDTSPDRVDPQRMWQVVRTSMKDQKRQIMGIFPSYHAAHCYRESCVLMSDQDFAYAFHIEKVGATIVLFPEK